MSQPTPYARQADFQDWSTEHPDTPHQGVSMDAEFNALVVTTAEILHNLALIQRDDGALKNGIVNVEALSAAVLALINSSTGIVAGAWQTATAYVAGTNWVSQGTGTYICAISHTSGAFATDLAAGKWVLIYNSAGVIPADGSVTTPKIVDGAVTLAKLAITFLDLTGTIRAQGGLAAGTATIGELLAAKKAIGDVLAKVERTTQAQGIVGYRIGGGTGGVNWDLRQSASLDALELFDGTLVRVEWLPGGQMDVGGTLRATNYATPLSGAGISMRYQGLTGFLDSYDHTASGWRAMQLRGSTVNVVCGGVTVLSASSADVNFPAGASIGAGSYSIGYRGIPKNAQDAPYTLAISDNGKCIFSENVAGQAIGIPHNSVVAIPVETVIAVRNRGAGPITILAAVDVTLRWAGSTSTGPRTVATNGLATLYHEKVNEWVISGAGVS